MHVTKRRRFGVGAVVEVVVLSQQDRKALERAAKIAERVRSHLEYESVDPWGRLESAARECSTVESVECKT